MKLSGIPKNQNFRVTVYMEMNSKKKVGKVGEVRLCLNIIRALSRMALT